MNHYIKSKLKEAQMAIDKELKDLLAWESQKYACEKIFLSCFTITLPCCILTIFLKGNGHKVALALAILFAGVGLKIFSIWYLLFGGILTIIEKIEKYLK